MKNYDIIIIGSGIQSLSAALILSKAGKKVIVLEGRDQIGGQTSKFEFAPGYQCNLIHDGLKWFDPRILKVLKIHKNNSAIYSPEVLNIALDSNNNHLEFYKDLQKTSMSMSKHSKDDAEVWKDFSIHIHNQTKILEEIYRITPTNLPNTSLKDIWSLKSILKPLSKTGTKGIVDFARIVPMMMPELMDEWFNSAFIRGALSSAGISMINQGPFSAATGLNLLHQHIYSSGVFFNIKFLNGGLVNLAENIAQSSISNGAVIQTESSVKSIIIKNGVCTGVRLANGDELLSNKTLSGLDPTQTFIHLIGANNLDPSMYRQIKNIKYRGCVSRIHYALNTLPKITGVSTNKMNTIFSISPSIEYLERAYDASKYGQISKNPYITFNIPTINDSTFAGEGKHVLSATIQYTPYHLRNTLWTDKIKNDLIENVTNIIEQYIPNFSSSIESSVLFSPIDLEKKLGMTEGSINHGELTLDQFFFMRPTIALSQYDTPFKNLFLCGSSTHPGCGPNGSSGYNAAMEVLKN